MNYLIIKYYFITIRKLFLLLIPLLVFLNSCEESSVEPQKAILFKVTPEVIYIGGEITISGNNLGYMPDSSYIALDTIFYIYPKDCIKWNNTTIKFTVPKEAISGKIRLISFKDTSNALDIRIEKLPHLDMVLIPSGYFQMGSSNGNTNEQPVHNVTITKSFYISRYEITQKFWFLVMGENPSINIGDDLPLHNISWSDAILFCNKYSNIMEYDSCYIIKSDTVTIDTNANGFRLPTEAEWEYACRAGSSSDFYSTGELKDIAWYSFSSGYMPHPVGQKLPNNFGLYDTHGNVWEWCNDWFDNNYYLISTSINPSGPKQGSRKVLRGGSFADGLFFLRASNRTIPWDSVDIRYCGLRIMKQGN